MHNNRNLRVGIIGGSARNGWAKLTHIPAVQQLPGLELSAVCTSHMESAEKSAREFKAPHAFADANDLANHPEVDMVVVSVKVKGHYDAVKAAVAAGKPVYCEWPLGLNTEQAMELQQLAEAKNVPNAIGLQARQGPAVNYMKDLIAQGYIGKPISVNMRVNSKEMGSMGPESAAYLFDHREGANLLTVAGGHALDALTYIVGDFRELSSITESHFHEAKLTDTDKKIEKTTPDQVMVTGKLKGGIVANVHIQGGIHHRQGSWLEVYGEKGTLVLTSPSRIQRGPYQLMGTDQLDGELKELVVPDRYYVIPDSFETNGGPLLNIAQAHSQFAKDIQEETSHMPAFADAVNVHKLLDTIVKAAQTGERQYL